MKIQKIKLNEIYIRSLKKYRNNNENPVLANLGEECKERDLDEKKNIEYGLSKCFVEILSIDCNRISDQTISEIKICSEKIDTKLNTN